MDKLAKALALDSLLKNAFSKYSGKIEFVERAAEVIVYKVDRCKPDVYSSVATLFCG